MKKIKITVWVDKGAQARHYRRSKMTKKNRNRIHDFMCELHKLSKILDDYGYLRGKAVPRVFDFYRAERRLLSEKYKDIKGIVNRAWNQEHKRARKTGDYSRLIYLPKV